MLASSATTLPEGDQWSYEVKWDGYRTLALKDGTKVKLLFASKVREGLTPHVRAELFPALRAIEQPRCPFANLPSSRTGHWGEGIAAQDMAALRWVKRTIVAEVAFVEWTRDGLLRHPEFIAVRTDKPTRAVKREA
jgi:bifunctional non-homologous end joining protein LigD